MSFAKHAITIVYDNIDDMINDSTLKPEMVVQTLGYHSRDDGGGGTFFIKDDSEKTEDNGMIFKTTNNLYAIRVIDNTEPISIKWYGAYGDGEHNDSPYIQTCLFNNNTKDIIFGEHETYLVKKPIWIESRGTIDFNGSIIKRSEDFVPNSGWLDSTIYIDHIGVMQYELNGSRTNQLLKSNIPCVIKNGIMDESNMEDTTTLGSIYVGSELMSDIIISDFSIINSKVGVYIDYLKDLNYCGITHDTNKSINVLLKNISIDASAKDFNTDNIGLYIRRPNITIDGLTVNDYYRGIKIYFSSESSTGLSKNNNYIDSFYTNGNSADFIDYEKIKMENVNLIYNAFPYAPDTIEDEKEPIAIDTMGYTVIMKNSNIINYKNIFEFRRNIWFGNPVLHLENIYCNYNDNYNFDDTYFIKFTSKLEPWYVVDNNSTATTNKRLSDGAFVNPNVDNMDICIKDSKIYGKSGVVNHFINRDSSLNYHNINSDFYDILCAPIKDSLKNTLNNRTYDNDSVCKSYNRVNVEESCIGNVVAQPYNKFKNLFTPKSGTIVIPEYYVGIDGFEMRNNITIYNNELPTTDANYNFTAIPESANYFHPAPNSDDASYMYNSFQYVFNMSRNDSENDDIYKNFGGTTDDITELIQPGDMLYFHFYARFLKDANISVRIGITSIGRLYDDPSISETSVFNIDMIQVAEISANSEHRADIYENSEEGSYWNHWQLELLDDVTDKTSFTRAYSPQNDFENIHFHIIIPENAYDDIIAQRKNNPDKYYKYYISNITVKFGFSETLNIYRYAGQTTIKHVAEIRNTHGSVLLIKSTDIAQFFFESAENLFDHVYTPYTKLKLWDEVNSEILYNDTKFAVDYGITTVSNNNYQDNKLRVASIPWINNICPYYLTQDSIEKEIYKNHSLKYHSLYVYPSNSRLTEYLNILPQPDGFSITRKSGSETIEQVSLTILGIYDHFFNKDTKLYFNALIYTGINTIGNEGNLNILIDNETIATYTQKQKEKKSITIPKGLHSVVFEVIFADNNDYKDLRLDVKNFYITENPDEEYFVKDIDYNKNYMFPIYKNGIIITTPSGETDTDAKSYEQEDLTYYNGRGQIYVSYPSSTKSIVKYNREKIYPTNVWLTYRKYNELYNAYTHPSVRSGSNLLRDDSEISSVGFSKSYVGDKILIIPKFEPSNCTETNISIKSVNTSIVDVEEPYLILKNSGSTTLTITCSNGLSKSIGITVT